MAGSPNRLRHQLKPQGLQSQLDLAVHQAGLDEPEAPSLGDLSKFTGPFHGDLASWFLGPLLDLPCREP